MDHLRLVMPPALFTILEFPFTRLAYSLFPSWAANAIISGAFAMCELLSRNFAVLDSLTLTATLRRRRVRHDPLRSSLRQAAIGKFS